ncbi:MAG: hypothetical protein OEX12_06455 [Gammaproteobacteria bacterium]|nr:hypothetical protein [Gammaproteobacteria bacterium]
MQIGGDPGAQAAHQLLQASNQVTKLSGKQLQAANNEVNSVKASALQNSAKQVVSTAGRKGSVLDAMA